MTEQLPLVAFQLAGEHNYDEFDVASQLASERGWMVPAYTLPPNADHIKIMRALVKLTLGHTLASTLADDIAQACETLAQKGGLHEHDRKRVEDRDRVLMARKSLRAGADRGLRENARSVPAARRGESRTTRTSASCNPWATTTDLPDQGGRDGIRSVPRTGSGAERGDPDIRPNDRLTDRRG